MTRSKRKNSSKSEESKSVKGNKESKMEGNEGTKDIARVGDEHILQMSQPLHQNTTQDISVSSILSDTRQVFDNSQHLDEQIYGQYMPNGAYVFPGIAPQYVNMQDMGQVRTPNKNINIGHRSQYQGPGGGLQNISTPMSNRTVTNSAYQNSVSNADLLKFMQTKFDEFGKRLEKIELLERKINDVDAKLCKLWSDVEQRVTKNSDRLDTLGAQTEHVDFEVEKTKEEVQQLSEQNQKLKESLNDIQAKALLNNLVIGGIEEPERETEESLEESVSSFLREKMKIEENRVENLKFERIHRIGIKRRGKTRNVVAVFRSRKDKDYVKTFRSNLKDTGYSVFDQYPAEGVEQRKKLLPIMRRAREDKKDAFIKYNKLIVDGALYTDGPYGKV